MNAESPFTADHNGFTHDGKPYVPAESNTVLLRLPAALNEDLDWSQAKSLAQQSEKAILWELDLGLSEFVFHPGDTAAFFSFSLAIEEFTKTLWPAFYKKTFGVSLYRGALPAMRQFPHWDRPDDLTRVQYLSEYLHRLVSFLPDTALPFAFFDLSEHTSAGKTAQLLSRARFEHIHLAIRGTKHPFAGLQWDSQGFSACALSASQGLYLPGDEAIDETVLGELDKIITQLNANGLAFRIIPEEKLTEQWDGIEKLIVPPHTISATGRRKLQGFLAAGGEVI